MHVILIVAAQRVCGEYNSWKGIGVRRVLPNSVIECRERE